MNDPKTLFRIGLLLPLFLMAATTVYLAAAFDIRTQFTGDGEMSPRSIPILAAGLMYIALGVVIWGEVRTPTDDGPLKDMLRPLLVVLATAGYIALFRPLGYVVSTLLFVAALFLIFQFCTRRPVAFVLYAIGVTAVFYGLFAVIFGVRLPSLTGGLI
ncbi:tripartite tricarboxylate transporter TctB family protein [Pseudooceanicola sp. C21-150M6]|uniref:tripartite tricarboxylate transporter TctB family protein n=1 Tax=Pseudooceanicola sp. C21-150M6 TaxID=3434355 RepID=UPI003D7FD41E